MRTGALRVFVQHPRRVWLRRAIFQVHLWVGMLLALYLVAIALSGAVLVFRQELTRWTVPGTLNGYRPEDTAKPEEVMSRFATMEPGGTVTLLQMPSPVLPAFVLEGKSGSDRPARWLGDPVTGSLRPLPRTWLDTVLDLHDYLLLPHRWGMQVNAGGAGGLLLLAMTGIVLWWPGTRIWTRGLRINLGAHWRRMNYDLHNAIGFWTLAIVFWWAVSGVYFGWYRQVTRLVDTVSPLQGMVSPSPAGLGPAPAGTRSSLGGILQAAQTVSPHGRVWSVSDPALRGEECYVLLDLRAPGDFSHRDIVRVRTADARILSLWRYGERHSLGDWVLWSMHPLHFGTTWGMPFKVLWSAFGLGLAALTVTGVLMYWNRFLRHRWTALRKSA